MANFLSKLGIRRNTLEEKMFFDIAIVVIFIDIISFITTVFERLSLASSLIISSCLVVHFILLFIANQTNNFATCYMIMCLVLNLLLIPSTFFLCGGINSGMILYMVGSCFLLAFCMRPFQKGICISLTIICYEACIIVGYRYPEFVHPMTKYDTYFDVLINVFVVGCALFWLCRVVLKEHDMQIRQTELLNKKLENLSHIDPLTNVDNRRFFFEKAKKIDIGKKCCLVMYDIDDFRKVNNNYGHLMGDDILSKFGELLRDNLPKDDSELIARYGAEEFVCILFEDTYEKAYHRIDTIREKFTHYRWGDEELDVTVSAGVSFFVANHDEVNLKHAIMQADECLYEAKEIGKNCIVCKDE